MDPANPCCPLFSPFTFFGECPESLSRPSQLGPPMHFPAKPCLTPGLCTGKPVGLRTMRTRLGPGKLQHRLCPEWPSDTPRLHACPPPPGLQRVFMWHFQALGTVRLVRTRMSSEKTMGGTKGIQQAESTARGKQRTLVNCVQEAASEKRPRWALGNWTQRKSQPAAEPQ